MSRERFELIKSNIDSNNILAIEMVDNEYGFLIRSDFFNKNLGKSINIQASDINIISELITGAKRYFSSNDTTYVADLEHLPEDVKQKLKDGIYRIGESKQVDGNLRAVILDENNVRTKDITMKKVVEAPEMCDVTRSIGAQLQMRQIMNKLNEISDLQEFLVARQRDTSIYVPFFNARDYILRAQNSNNKDVIARNLKEANRELTTALNSLYTDYNTCANNLIKTVSRPIFQNSIQRNRYIKYIVEDVQIAYKYVPVYLAILNYTNDYATALQVSNRYMQFITDFFEKKYGSKTIVHVLQEYFNYNDSNRDCWIMLARKYRDTPKENLLNNVVVMSIEGE